MTIKQLIGLGPDQLEKMTTEELRQHCEPLLKYAVVGKVKTDDEGELNLDDIEGPSDKPKHKRTRAKAKTRWELEAQRLAKEHGIVVELPKELKL